MITESILASREEPTKLPSISVVIPLYNAARWIRATLESVLAQDLEACAMEIIVVDDGSTDGGPQIAHTILRDCSLPFLILSTPNGGPSRARNIGWQAARSSWVQFLDADDLLHPEKLSAQLRQCRGTGESTAAIYSDFARLDQVGDSWIPREPHATPRISANILEDLLRAENFIQLGSLLFRRDWLAKVGGFREDQRIIEDVDLLLRLAIAGARYEFAPTQFPGMYYRQLESSLSKSDDEKFARGCFNNAKMVEQYWRASGNFNMGRRILLADIYLFAALLSARQSPLAFREMIRGNVALVAPAAIRSARARRLLLRSSCYSALGYNAAGSADAVVAALLQWWRRSRTATRNGISADVSSRRPNEPATRLSSTSRGAP